MSKPDKWMPLYIGDYLADTMHLDAREHGAYLLLIMHYWRSGPLPDDDRMLSGIARTDRRLWAAEIGPIVRAFFVVEDGKLHHKRVDQELEHAAEISEKRRGAAHRRHAKSGKNDTEPPGGAHSNGQQECHNQPANVVHLQSKGSANAQQVEPHARTCASASPSPSPSKKDSVPSGTDAEAASAVPSPADLLWSVGVPILKRLTSKSDGQCRAMLGKMRRDVQDDCPRLLLILQEAASAQLVDPVAWLTAATGGRKSGESASDRRIREQRETMHRLVYGEDEPVTIDQIPDRSLLQ